MKKITLVLLILLSLISCESSDKVETVAINNKYSVDIPTNLTVSTQLNDEASLQYMNAHEELYIVVLDESIADFKKAIDENNLGDQFKDDLEGYSKMLLELFVDRTEATNVSEVNKTTINGLPALIYSFDANLSGHDVKYQIAYLEGQKDYYQVLTWTLGSKNEINKNKMKNMIMSFKEI